MPLPRIAFFHGGGSNSSISAIQCAQVSGILSEEFEFVFFDAPFQRGAGPGILPAFAEPMYQPYRTWFTLSTVNGIGVEVSDGGGFEDGENGEDGVERVWELMRKAGGGFVGVMGFSQGTRIAGGLLLDQQKRQEEGFKKAGMGLKFGVMCMGGGAPMVSAISRDGSEKLDLIKIPTLHLHGLKDGNLTNGRTMLAAHYAKDNAKLLEIDYHHAMPWIKKDVNAFVSQIRELWASVKDE
ncbi:hypothetical protein HYALB_00013617 [Hymenoscyphus albidus]|uniref:Serine hydrolase domain-containing protein n=1 Tax=Hymenoscyphus albidus TaxID=595503 RepID=A0A9N9QB18_9HELO|nr:hypothetical protein HYALB_00013617 [Hymenoscyphus albidus]